MNLIGELVLARNQLVQTVKQPGDAGATLQRLSHVTSELQEQVMKTRMQPVARVFERLPRMVRDLSATTKKQVSVHIDGNSTEIDRALVEAIRDPVMHIIRNSIDHGIETPAEREAVGKPAVGRINVRAAHEGGMVLIEIRDDGRGIDPRKVRDVAIRRGVITAQEAARLTDRDAQALVFQPGFSTAAEVTDISGRGVGMDVVRSHVERAGGKVDLDSSVGVGTVIRLKMPLTLAIVPALLVRSGGHRFAIPQVNLTELVHIPEENAERAVEWLCGVPVFRLRGEVLPLVSLSDTLKMPKPSGLGVSIVVVAVGDQRYGLLVDEINDTEEIVVKPLSGWLKRLPCYAGATVLGDGGIALILEVTGIATMSGIKTRSSTAALVAMEATTALQPHVLVECGDGEQCAVPLGMVARLENVATTQIERVGGEEVLQYRGAVIPVIRVERLLPMGQTPPPGTHQSLLVFEFASPVAVAVNRVIDIANIAVESTSGIGPAGSFGRQVVLGRATTRLDIYALVEQLAPAAMNPVVPPAKKTVLVIDDNLAWRGGVADQLRAMGATVLEARSMKDVLRAPRTTYSNCDVVIYASGDEDQDTVVMSLKSVMAIEPQLLFVARPGRRPVATAGAVVVERSDRASIAAAALNRRAA